MKTKKILLSSVTAIATFLTINSCMDKTNNQTPISDEPNMKVLENHLLSQSDAQKLANAYEKNNYQLVNQGKNKPDTKEIYYDIEVLENYLKYVKEEAKTKGVTDLGIVVAFGQYSYDDQQNEKLNKDYLGQQTVYFRPVEKIKSTDSDSTSYKTQALRFQPANRSLTDIDALDFGQLTPPEK